MPNKKRRKRRSRGVDSQCGSQALGRMLFRGLGQVAEQCAHDKGRPEKGRDGHAHLGCADAYYPNPFIDVSCETQNPQTGHAGQRLCSQQITEHGAKGPPLQAGLVKCGTACSAQEVHGKQDRIAEDGVFQYPCLSALTEGILERFAFDID
jgi:hypothetical protein